MGQSVVIYLGKATSQRQVHKLKKVSKNKYMSANNELVIYKKGEKFIVGHMDLDCGWNQKEMIVSDTLEEAIKKANEFMLENEVEYGLKIMI